VWPVLQRCEALSVNSLFCLCYRRDNTFLGVVMVEARTLLEARMLAAIDGLDQLADFLSRLRAGRGTGSTRLAPLSWPDDVAG